MRGVFADYLRLLRGGTYRVTDCRLSRVRYRRGTRCVLQYTLRLADSATGHERIQSVTGVMDTKDRTRRKWEKLQASYRREVPDGSSAFEPFTFIPDLGMLVEVFTHDRRLPTLPLAVAGPSQMIVQEADASPAVRKAAEALAALQLEHITTPERHPLPNQLAVLERTGIILRWACPHLGAEIEETVGAVVASLGEVPPTPTNRDLKLDHMLLDGDRPCLVDLDNFAEADPVIYVANGRSDAGRLS